MQIPCIREALSAVAQKRRRKKNFVIERKEKKNMKIIIYMIVIMYMMMMMIKRIRNLYDRIRTGGKKNVSPNRSVYEDIKFLENLNAKRDAPYKPVDTDLRYLAGVCARGDADAMLELSEYFRQKKPNDKAAVMWLLRAAVYGNTVAQERVCDEIKQNRYFLEESLIPYENFIPGKHPNRHSGYYSGDELNAAGLLIFQQNEYYMIAGLDKNRAILIWKKTGYDSADEDGFGAETYYDMFYVDEFFQPISGVPRVYNVSILDIRQLAGPKEEYYDMKHAMVEAMSSRKQIPLWTEFVPEK